MIATGRARRRPGDGSPADVRYFQYLQWVAAGQWQRARENAAPSASSATSPSWSTATAPMSGRASTSSTSTPRLACRRTTYRRTGQDWGLPAYRWDVVAPGGYEWLAGSCTSLRRPVRGVSRRSPGRLLPDLRPRSDRRGFFSPPDEPTQIAQGEALMTLLRRHGACIIAEDLGVVPDFVRESPARLGVPGLKVMRWERDWHSEGQPFRDPRSFPACSVAISGTHDTESMADWWDRAGRRSAAPPPRSRHSARPACISGEALHAHTRRADLGPLHAGSASCCCRSRTCSGGGSGSTRRRWSATTTGRGGCRVRSSH